MELEGCFLSLSLHEAAMYCNSMILVACPFRSLNTLSVPFISSVLIPILQTCSPKVETRYEAHQWVIRSAPRQQTNKQTNNARARRFGSLSAEHFAVPAFGSVSDSRGSGQSGARWNGCRTAGGGTGVSKSYDRRITATPAAGRCPARGTSRARRSSAVAPPACCG